MLKDNILMAFAELRANKLRSLLTMLGIVIGIASVIAIMTVGESLNKSMSEAFNDMGANNIEFYVTNRNIESDEEIVEFREMKDYDFVSDEIFEDICTNFKGRVKGIAVQRDIGSGKIGRSGKDLSINIVGVNSAAESLNKLTFLAGRDLSKRDYEDKTRVVVISSKLADKLYGSPAKAVGQQIECTLEGKYCEYVIVGVYEHKESANDFSITKSATNCYIPIKTAYSQINEEYQIDSFQVIATPEEDTLQLCVEIKDYVNNKYYKDNDAYYLDGYSNQDVIKETTDMLNNIKLALSAIAAISLLVGGIGVMNIMVVSITERTREIGTRKALGATNFSIRLQFITESIVMCLVGGTIGVMIGVAIGLEASKALKFPGILPVKWILISVVFSAAFGIFFGLYPAGKAAKMNPIDALRYE
ncbi:MAG: ABC transporter permease [Mogibacterium sp.]|nr:ABC transporter permease [Mogibacterium sp.]